MAIDYASIAEEALAGIQEAGAAMTLTRLSGGTFSPTTGTYAGQTTTAYPCTGLFQVPRAGDTWYGGTTIRAGDRQVLLAASGMEIVPAPGDDLDGYKVVAVQPVAPGGIDLMYRVLVRK